jgi:glycosyltransferase involved in cell wall biosynthesis
MNVGVYLGWIYETEGGGFTFQESVIREILKSSTKHRFIFFYSGHNIFANQQMGHHKAVKIPKYFDISSSLFNGTHGLRQWFTRKLRRFFPKQKVWHFFDLWSKNEQLHLLWMPGFKDIRTSIPYIYTIWDLQHRLQPFFPEVSDNGQWEQREEMFTRMTQRAAYIVTGTETGKKELQLFYGISNERIKLLLHPTPGFVLQQKEKLPLKLKVPEGYVFYPAQFWPHKNHITLLEALHILKTRFNRVVNIVLVGHNYGNRKYIEDRARELGIGSQISIFGFLSREDLISLYQHAKALVYVSHFGPENLPPLEAMALGCPVLYGNVDGAKEQLGDAALIVEHRSAEKLAEGIMRIMEDENLRSDLIQKGCKRASSYTTKEYVNDLVGIVDEFEPLRKTWE